MCTRTLAVAAAFGLLAVPGFASAAPAAPPAVGGGISASPEFLPVRDGCGRGFYLARWQDRWGRWHRRCVPFRGGHSGPWNGGGRGPHWRPGWDYYR
jgi:hypothetical protein